MKVLLDTNVVLDAIAKREPFYLDAQNVIDLILNNKLEGYITANSITDIFYIAKKHLSQNDLHSTMRSLFTIFSIVDVLGTDCHKALDFPLDDYEDALLVVCSSKTAIDYIITRDKEFLQKAKPSIPVISPADFLKMPLR
jgi:predicted nucleic acid-binding protein